MTVLIGAELPEVEELRSVLGAELVVLPDLEADLHWSWAPALEAWRESVATGPRLDRVVVAAWGSAAAEPPFVELTDPDWLVGGEQRLAIWAAALGAAVRRCADGGVVVAVIERAHVLDSASHTLLQLVADGAENLVRSMARAEGGRGVRVNAVTSSVRAASAEVRLAPAPLPGYPGSVSRHLAPVVAQLLEPAASGLTGRVIDVDLGRSWR